LWRLDLGGRRKSSSTEVDSEDEGDQRGAGTQALRKRKKSTMPFTDPRTIKKTHEVVVVLVWVVKLVEGLEVVFDAIVEVI
jgi:hypothetical protein